MAEVPLGMAKRYEKSFAVGGFPIYHKGELTVHDIPEWNEIFNRNSWKLRNQYNERWLLSNNYERAVIGMEDEVPPREKTRYIWAASQIVGNKILEIGCSSGYGLRFFHHKEIQYLGVDYDKDIIDYARKNFGDLEGVAFAHADINHFPLEQYDTIIAFEVIEHLDNGLELAQKLKEHCKKLIITTPYNEEPGFWGPHHKLHWLKETDFHGFKFIYMEENSQITDSPEKASLIMGVWEKGEEAEPTFTLESDNVLKDVLCEVLTSNRYYTTLPTTLYAIAMQETVPAKLVICDDTPSPINLTETPLYQHLFALLARKGMDIYIEVGGGRGIPQSRDFVLRKYSGKHKYIWRVDDDEMPEPDVLRLLYNTMVTNHDVAAVGGSVLDPNERALLSERASSNDINKIRTHPNMQWYENDMKMFHVEHLTSSFLFDTAKAIEVGGYNLSLSPAGHREETILTHSLFKKGYGLYYIKGAITWHMRNPEGGIRKYPEQMFESDEKVFDAFINGESTKTAYIVLDNGIGDHYMFKEIWPEVKEKYKSEGKKVVLATAYGGIIEDADEIISIAEAKNRLGGLEKYDVYARLAHGGQKKTVQQAYREMYL
jgi:SAM-dependent methyltransferase